MGGPLAAKYSIKVKKVLIRLDAINHVHGKRTRLTIMVNAPRRAVNQT